MVKIIKNKELFKSLKPLIGYQNKKDMHTIDNYYNNYDGINNINNKESPDDSIEMSYHYNDINNNDSDNNSDDNSDDTYKNNTNEDNVDNNEINGINEDISKIINPDVINAIFYPEYSSGIYNTCLLTELIRTHLLELIKNNDTNNDTNNDINNNIKFISFVGTSKMRKYMTEKFLWNHTILYCDLIKYSDTINFPQKILERNYRLTIGILGDENYFGNNKQNNIAIVISADKIIDDKKIIQTGEIHYTSQCIEDHSTINILKNKIENLNNKINKLQEYFICSFLILGVANIFFWHCSNNFKEIFF